MLTIRHKKEFLELGYTRISRAVANDGFEEVSDFLWMKLAESGIQEGKPATWSKPKPKGLQTVSKTEVFDPVFNGVARKCLDSIMAEKLWEEPKHWGQILLSLPTDKEWNLPNNAWHLDIPQKINDISSPGVQLFVCIEDVTTKCGATVVAAGSHRLIGRRFKRYGLPDKGASSLIRNQLAKEYDWFQQLWNKNRPKDQEDSFLQSFHTVDDVPVRVDELTGKRGDLILMHPYLLHAPAPNIGPNIRLILTQRVYSLGSY